MNSTFDNERAVLGCLIQYPEKFGHYVNLITDKLFIDPVHKDIFRVIEKTYKDYPPEKVDSVIMKSFFNSPTLKVEAYQCAEGAFESTPLTTHLKILANVAKEKMLKDGYDRIALQDLPVDELQEAIKSLTSEVEKAFPDEVDYSRDYDEYVDGLVKPRNVLMSRFKGIDYTTGGFEAGSLVIVGARPSVGKTTFALNLAQNIAEYGRKVIFFSLEMTKATVFDKLIARGCHLDSSELKRGASADLREGFKHFFSDSGLKDNLKVVTDITTVEAISTMIRKECPAVAIVDYCQIVQTVKSQDTVRTRIDYISQTLKQVAKSIGCVVVLLSQLRRADGTTTRPPSMADLKESSGLEQDGDYIFLLYRPFVQDKSVDRDGTFNHKPSETQLILEKNKFGKVGIFGFEFDLAHQDFKEKTG